MEIVYSCIHKYYWLKRREKYGVEKNMHYYCMYCIYRPEKNE